ncbi:MAG: type II secretion system F family protein [Candidatus Spechtbacteria bacterium]|nr:type II secretion system F family protein [Candidatus Spechtbacteria bacterium]
MPLFLYQAKSADGKTVIGEQEAKNKAELAHALKAQNFLLIFATIKNAAGGKEQTGITIPNPLIFFQGVSVEDKMMFASNLAIMVFAGVPLTRALVTLSRQTQNEEFVRALLDIESNIKQGKQFSQALAQHPKIFNTLFVSMVSVGEASGTLVNVLNILSKQLKKEHELRSRIKGALIYPAVIITAMVVIGVLMMVFVIPVLSHAFNDLAVDLPITTRAILGAGGFFQHYWWAIGIGTAIVIYGIRRFFATKFGSDIFDWFLLHAWLLSGVNKQINTAQFSRTLSSLVSGGVPILESLRITADTLGNHYYKDSLVTARENVQQGKTLHEALDPYIILYTPLVIQMIEVGEETGKLADILNQLASFYEDEVSNLTQNLSSIIEPVLMIVIGVAVGFFAMSIIQPMYSIMNKL